MDRLRIFIILLVCFASHKTNGQIYQEKLDHFSYNTSNGLPNDVISSFEIDSLGNMFFACESGVYRFDGSQYHLLNEDSMIFVPNQAIHKNSKDQIQFIHKNNVYEVEFSTIHKLHGLDSTNQLSSPRILYESEKFYYLGIDQTLYKFSKAKSAIVELNYLTGTRMKVVSSKSSNSLYFVNDKCIYSLSEVTSIKKEWCNSSIILDLHWNSANELVLLLSSEIVTLDLKANRVSKKLKLPEGVIIGCLKNVSNNKFLVSINTKLYEYDLAENKLTYEYVDNNGNPFTSFGGIKKIEIDQFGNTYLITQGEGIIKLTLYQKNFTTYQNNQIGPYFAKWVYPDKPNNRILVGTFAKGVLVFDTNQNLLFQFEAFEDASIPSIINSILPFSKDRYLVMLAGQQNGYIIDFSKTSPAINKYEEIELNSNGYYVQVHELNSNKYLYSHYGAYFLNLDEPPKIIELFEDTQIAEKFCMLNGTLYGVKPQTIIEFTKDYKVKSVKENFQTGFVRSIEPNLKSNGILIVGDNGLFEYLVEQDSIFEIYLSNDIVYSAIYDQRGTLWAGTHDGLIHLDGDQILHYYKEDGLPSNEFNTSAVSLSKDGEIFMGTSKGMISFYPEQLPISKESIKVILSDLKVNGKRIDIKPNQVPKLNFEHDKNSISIGISTIGKKLPSQYSYQYFMEGFDKTWIDGSNLGKVNYNLKPGNYTFNYTAANSFQKNPSKFQSFTISILPPFWETWLFRALLALIAFSFIGYVIYSILDKINQKRIYQLKVQNKLQTDRNKMSRELHDNIGAQVANISRSVDWLISQDKVESNEKEKLKQVSHISKQLGRDIRDTIWATKKLEINIQEFSDRLKSYIQGVKAGKPKIEILVLELIDYDHTFSPEEALNLFRICQEAIQNAIKHASARKIQLSVNKTSETHFELIIVDDGNGFILENNLQEGNGLNNMKTRAIEIGYHFEIKSKPGKGTQLKISKK